MTIIAISACQSQGKTTVLNSLADMGYNVIPQKTSRSILTEWGYTLNEVNSYKVLTRNFQEEMIKRHAQFMAPYIDSKEVFFQERSLADIFSYCLNILGPFNEMSEFVDNYYQRCRALQQSYDCVIFLSGRKSLVTENDGVRSVNRHFTNMVDMLIKYHVDDFNNGNVLYVDTPSHKERLRIIEKHVHKLIEKKNDNI